MYCHVEGSGINLIQFQSVVQHQQMIYVLSTFFSTIFGVLNITLAFYNLYLLTTTVNLHLKGMRMKIDLSEKALLERRLPSDIMNRLVTSSAESLER
ncbi:hypothetical protein DICVIV_09815 [Dictyocaulus viviparus]|uniref:Uncharacterized protein n=1 Tax=Dictyocaulus viviparus TaxID=29172 RepID=A0A0D8XK63_DICVI|nr:hypothetical protein DICVIV_09815 [Dictyocaulus viviparus]